MERAVIIDVLSTSAHYSSRNELIGQEVEVHRTFEFEVFEEGYVSLYYEDKTGRQGCIFGCKISYEGAKPTWEI